MVTIIKVVCNIPSGRCVIISLTRIFVQVKLFQMFKCFMDNLGSQMILICNIVAVLN